MSFSCADVRFQNISGLMEQRKPDLLAKK